MEEVSAIKGSDICHMLGYDLLDLLTSEGGIEGKYLGRMLEACLCSLRSFQLTSYTTEKREREHDDGQES